MERRKGILGTVNNDLCKPNKTFIIPVCQTTKPETYGEWFVSENVLQAMNNFLGEDIKKMEDTTILCYIQDGKIVGIGKNLKNEFITDKGEIKTFFDSFVKVVVERAEEEIFTDCPHFVFEFSYGSKRMIWRFETEAEELKEILKFLCRTKENIAGTTLFGYISTENGDLIGISRKKCKRYITAEGEIIKIE